MCAMGKAVITTLDHIGRGADPLWGGTHTLLAGANSLSTLVLGLCSTQLGLLHITALLATFSVGGFHI